jgi:hypothetical protein
MKLKNNLLLGALAALSIASASADVTYISGSTAFEGVADAALTNFVANNYGGLVTWDNATLGKETYAIYNWGTDASHVTNLIIVHWTGSEGGIQTINAPTNNPAPVAFLPTNSPAGLVVPANVSGYPNNQSAQVAFSDTFQASSIFSGTKAGDGKNYGTATDFKVAAQGFVFAGSTNWPSSHGTNITIQQARSLYGGGSLPLSLITGVAADTNNTVYAIGRNIDSGTRVSALAETGIGTKGSIVQFFVASSSNIYQYPIDTNDGIVNATVGLDGYSSTGNLEAALTNVLASGQIDTSASKWNGVVPNVPSVGANYLVGYLGAKSAFGYGNAIVPFTYNGVPCTTANIENGTYTFWGYEHILKSTRYTNTTATTLVNALVSYIKGETDSQLGAGNASLNNLQVLRSTDGAAIEPVFIQ